MRSSLSHPRPSHDVTISFAQLLQSCTHCCSLVQYRPTPTKLVSRFLCTPFTLLCSVTIYTPIRTAVPDDELHPYLTLLSSCKSTWPFQLLIMKRCGMAETAARRKLVFLNCKNLSRVVRKMLYCSPQGFLESYSSKNYLDLPYSS